MAVDWNTLGTDVVPLREGMSVELFPDVRRSKRPAETVYRPKNHKLTMMQSCQFLMDSTLYAAFQTLWRTVVASDGIVNNFPVSYPGYPPTWIRETVRLHPGSFSVEQIRGTSSRQVGVKVLAQPFPLRSGAIWSHLANLCYVDAELTRWGRAFEIAVRPVAQTTTAIWLGLFNLGYSNDQLVEWGEAVQEIVDDYGD